MKIETVAVFRGLHKFPNGNEVANLDLLSGKDQNGKVRYLKGSFVVTEKSKGIKEAFEALGQNESLLVDAKVLNLFGEPNGKFVNYRGLLDSVSLRSK